jgi:hypothetical protein
MRVLIKYPNCGGLGTIVECNYSKLVCYFCREYNYWFTEEKEITPTELIALLKGFNCIIILKPTRPK